MAETKTTMADLRKMNEKDLMKMLTELNAEKAKLRPLIVTGKEKQNHKINALQKQKARILTLMKEKSSNTEKHAQ